jgi:hypothetical protein
MKYYKIEIINTIKLLIYKDNPTLLEKVDFEDDNVFVEPLLFSYFNAKNKNQFSNEILEEILQGYFRNQEILKVTHSFNKNGIAYLPQRGYFRNGENTPFESIFKIDEFEILKELHPIQDNYLREYYKGHIINKKPVHKSVWKENYKDVEKAILIIKEYLPKFYQDLVFANKRIYLHDNPKILNFTTVETLGMLYFYVIGNNNVIYFIEELVHQGSHNFLYYVVHNRKDYFKIEVDTIIMRDLTKQQWDYRNVYGAYHGLYTVTKRVECFDMLLSKNVFSGREKHELLGRLADMFPRFQTGLELLNLDAVYTDKGKKFYLELTQKCESILKKYKKLTKEFDLSHRDLDFRYNEFCLTNSFEDFQRKDIEGYYNF